MRNTNSPTLDKEIARSSKSQRNCRKKILMFGQKYAEGDDANLAFNTADQKKVWKQHYKDHLNVEFSWNSNRLQTAYPVSVLL